MSVLEQFHLAGCMPVNDELHFLFVKSRGTVTVCTDDKLLHHPLAA